MSTKIRCNFYSSHLCIVKAEIFINGYIGDMFNTLGDSNCYNLQKLNEDITNLPAAVTELNVHINSGGGLVSEGFAIYDKLVSLPYTVNTIVEGMCGSIATVIAQAGKKGTRRMFQNSEYFVHNPLWIPSGPDAHNATDLEKLTADLRKNEKKILDFYVRSTGANRHVLAAKMQTETTLNATEAKQLGFIDEIITTDVVAMVKYQCAAAVTTRINNLNKPNTPQKHMEKVLKAEIKTGFNKVAALFNTLLKGRTVNAALTLNDETLIYTDTDALEEGSLVFTDEALTTPMENGSYTTADGATFVVTDGEVTTITPAPEAEEKVSNRRVARLVAKLAVKEAELAAHKAEKERFIAAAKAAREEFEAFKNKIITGGNEFFEVVNTDPKTQSRTRTNWQTAAANRRKNSN